MAEEIYEIVVRISPEGAEETQEAMEGAQESVEETADAVEEQTDSLDRFSRKWRGAMTVIAGALAVATGALMLNAPIVQDLMDGLMAVVEGFALQLDQFLRPALQGVVDDLFGFAEAVGEAEGPLGDFLGALAGLAALVSGGIGLAVVTGNTAALGTALGLLTGPIGWLLLAIGLLAAAWITNFGDIRGVTERVVGDINEIIGAHLPQWQAWFEQFVEAVTGWWAEWGDEVEMLTNLAFDLIGAVIVTQLDFLLSLFTAFIQLLTGDWEGAWDTIAGFVERSLARVTAFLDRWFPGARQKFEDIANGIKEAFLRPIRDMVATANRLIAGVTGARARARSRLSGYGINVPGLASGGRITQGGLAEVHAGEQVVPAAQVERTGDPGGRNRFADREELVVRFEPSRFERFVSASLEDSPANSGRGAGPRG